MRFCPTLTTSSRGCASSSLTVGGWAPCQVRAGRASFWVRTMMDADDGHIGDDVMMMMMMMMMMLAGDPDVKNGANLLDRLIKDIVTESEVFDVERFIPLLQASGKEVWEYLVTTVVIMSVVILTIITFIHQQHQPLLVIIILRRINIILSLQHARGNRMHAINADQPPSSFLIPVLPLIEVHPYIRQLLVGWITVMDSVPHIKPYPPVARPFRRCNGRNADVTIVTLTEVHPSHEPLHPSVAGGVDHGAGLGARHQHAGLAAGLPGWPLQHALRREPRDSTGDDKHENIEEHRQKTRDKVSDIR
jgi:hypothetical protein